MSTAAILLILIALISVANAAFVASCEAALARLTRGEAAQLLNEGKRGARRVQQVLDRPAEFMAVAVFVRSLFEIAGGVAMALVLAEYFEQWWAILLISVGGYSLIAFMAVGVGARTIGRQHSTTVSLATVPPLLLLTRVLAPITKLIVLIANWLTPGKALPNGPFASELELREMVDLATESQVIDDDEREMVHNVFEFADTIVREVMVPRTDMVRIEKDTTVHDALRLHLQSGFSRIPVIGEDSDDVIGISYLKDLADKVYYGEGVFEAPVSNYIRDLYVIPESKPVDALLKEMQKTSNHVALVIDEYGGTAGLVTMEDLVEEIVGEIDDEFDQASPEPVQNPDGSYLVSARTNLDEVAELFDIVIDEEEVDTIGGLLAKTLGQVPISGMSAATDQLTMVATGHEGRRKRIASVIVSKNLTEQEHLND